MKRAFLFAIFTLCIATCSIAKQPPGQQSLPRIAIAGIAIESSTFSPAHTEEAAFHAQYGTDLFSRYPFLSKDSPMLNRAIWIPTLGGHALPGGAVTRHAYESLVNKTLDSLKKHLPYDGLYFDIHGGMSLKGLEAPKGDFIVRIRKVVGTKTIISTQKTGYSTTMLFAAAIAFFRSSVVGASLTRHRKESCQWKEEDEHQKR